MIVAHGLPVMTEQFGTSVTYTEPDSDDVTLTAILGDIVAPDEVDSGGNRVARRERAITIGKDSSAAYGGVSSINLRHGRFTIDSESWAVLIIESETESVFRLRLGRPTAITVSRADLYKGK